MGKYLGLDLNDTYEIYMIREGLTTPDYMGYVGFIREMKEAYGKERGLNRHQYMGDYLIKDFRDFHCWIAVRHYEILNQFNY